MAVSLKGEVSNSYLYASLYGLREVFRQEFQIKDIFFSFSEEKKSFLRRKDHTSYPYASFRLSTFNIPKNQVSPKTMRYMGVTSRDVTQATMKKHYVYPFVLSGEFSYINSSIQETLLFVEHFSLIAVNDRLVFRIRQGEIEWFCRCAIDDVSVSLSERQLSDNSDPGKFEITQSFELSSKAGISRDVSHMQREPSYTFVVDGEEQ